jgi:GT2 family glycosyltransferase
VSRATYPRIRLVVLNFDGGEDVLRCIRHLLATEWPPDRLEVVAVDNASSDGSPEAIAAEFPTVRLIRSPVNGGFPANNLALRDLQGIDYVGLVNNDAFVEPGFLEPLVATLEHDEELGAACPKIVLADHYRPVAIDTHPGHRLDGYPAAVLGPGWSRPDDLVDPRPVATATTALLYLPVGDADPEVEHAVTLLNNVGNELVDGWFGADRGLHHPDDGSFDEPVDVFAWCGAAVLFPARYLADIGLFDDRLFLYYEDLELAWRGRSRGWRYRTAPASVVRHHLGASSTIGSPLFRYQVERNRLVVLAMHAPAGVAATAAARHLAATASYARRDLVARRPPTTALVRLRLSAFAGFIRLLPHAIAHRRRTNRRATVPVTERAGAKTRRDEPGGLR